ncbi:MAG TPA: hypothetical protein P5081_23490 [Phycisphaerae bacterium]|nr:hypothetical protein [Phycisphaerae bacterium]
MSPQPITHDAINNRLYTRILRMAAFWLIKFHPADARDDPARAMRAAQLAWRR